MLCGEDSLRIFATAPHTPSHTPYTHIRTPISLLFIVPTHTQRVVSVALLWFLGGWGRRQRAERHRCAGWEIGWGRGSCRVWERRAYRVHRSSWFWLSQWVVFVGGLGCWEEFAVQESWFVCLSFTLRRWSQHWSGVSPIERLDRSRTGTRADGDVYFIRSTTTSLTAHHGDTHLSRWWRRRGKHKNTEHLRQIRHEHQARKWRLEYDNKIYEFIPQSLDW